MDWITIVIDFIFSKNISLCGECKLFCVNLLDS